MLVVVAGAVVWVQATEAVAGMLRVCPSGCPFSSIQSAIDAAQTADTINVGPGTYTENLLIDPPVTAKILTLIGTGAKRTIIDGSQGECVMQIDKGYTVSIFGMTLTNGECPPAGGILTDGTLTLTNVTVSNNKGDEGGGGIANDIDGTLTLINTTLKDNTALSQRSGMGGGLLNFGVASIVDSTVKGNVAPAEGGGIENEGRMEITNSRIVNNMTNGVGGGIDNRNNNLVAGSAVLKIGSSLISNNTAFTGGGFFNSDGMMTVTATTIRENAAGEGGGLENSFKATTTLKHSKIVRNTASTDAGGVSNDRGKLTLTDCSVNDNQAVSSLGAKGGGLGCLAAPWC